MCDTCTSLFTHMRVYVHVSLCACMYTVCAYVQHIHVLDSSGPDSKGAKEKGEIPNACPVPSAWDSASCLRPAFL